MTEIWKQIPFNTLYEVSTRGNFRNAKTQRQKIFDIEALKSTQTRIRVDVKNTIKKGSGFYLHRLVAMTFIPNPQNLEEVNHIDGNPYNNCVENLEWITREENMRHFHENREKYANKNVKQVNLYCSETDTLIKSYKCIDECIELLGLNISYITLYNALNTSIYEYKTDVDAEKSSYGTNKYVGVRFNKATQKYIATYKNKYIGSFDAETDAANAYDDHLRKLGILPRHANFPKVGELQAIVGKKKYQSVPNTVRGVYVLQGKNQYLKFEEIIAESAPTVSDIEWRQIDEAPNYSVSNTGLVKHTRLDRLLTGYNRNGYLQVTIRQGDIGIARLVHRLVATAFIHNDDPVNRIYVDHIDTDPRNNCVSNLRWTTPKENMNNELTRQNISAGHMRKSPKVYQVDIHPSLLQSSKGAENPSLLQSSGNIIGSAENAIALSKQIGVKSAIIQNIANYYKKVVQNEFNTECLTVVQGQQKTYEGKWIFLYENECNILVQIIEKCLTENNTHRNSGKSIVQYDCKTGDIIATYSSMYEASKKLNIKPMNI